MAAALMVMGGPLVPSVTAEPAAATSAASSRWSPEPGTPWADTEPVPAAVRTQFLGTWTARFEAGGDAVRATADERASYQRLSAAQRRGLVVDLINHWYDSVPGFADAMAGNTDGPAWTNPALAGMVHTVIFDPDALKGDDDGDAPVAPADPTTTGAYRALTDKVATALAGTPAPAATAVSVPATPPVTQMAIADAPRSLLRDLRVPAADAVATTSDPVADLQAQANALVESAEPTIARADDLLAETVGLPVGVGNTRYRACQKPANGAAQCGPLTPLGAPAAVPGGIDWQFTLGPFDLTQPGKVTFNLELTKVDSSSTRSGHYYVRYRPPYFDRDLLLGFGDRAPLQQNQSAAVTVDQPLTSALDKTVNLVGRIRHNGPATTDLALSVAYGDVSGRLLLAPAPALFTARARVPLSGSPMAFGVTAPNRPVLTVEATAPGGRFSGVVDRVPQTVDVEITRDDALRIAYKASDRIDRVTVAAEDIAVAGGLLDASVAVEGIPTEMAVVAGGAEVSATGSSAITKLTGQAVVLPAAGGHPQQFATATVTGIPAGFTYTTSNANGVPTHTYAATGKVGSVTAGYLQTAANGSTVLAAGAKLTGLPATLTLRTPPEGVVVDLGSDQLDSIEAWASKGTSGALAHRSDLAANQVQYWASGAEQRAYLRVVGFKGAGFQRTAAGGITADVRLGSGAGFDATFADGTRSGTVKVSNIPNRMTFTAEGNRFVYDAHGTVINSITAQAAMPGLSGTAAVTGIPGQATVVNDVAGTGLAYTATSAISAIAADVTAGANRAVVGVTGVPTAWSLVANRDKVDFTSASGVGRIQAAVAVNQATFPSMAGDHAAATFDQAANRAGASLAISGLKKLTYVNGLSRSFALQMGNGGNLNLNLDGTLGNGMAATLDGVIQNVPTSITAALANDGTVDVKADRSATITLRGGYGPRSALNTIALPNLHGLAVRDAAGSGGVAYKGLVHLVGLPTRVTAGNGTFHVEGLFGQPGYTSLDIDALIDDTSPRRSLKAKLNGMAAQPYVIDGTMTVTPVTGGGSNMLAQLVTNRSLGSLYVAAAQDAMSGRVDISNIPATVRLDVHERPGSTRAIWSASQQINSVTAAVKAGFDSGVTGTVRGYLALAQIPSTMDITVGRSGAGDGPTLTYSANADTLDAFISADGSLGVPSGQVGASLAFDLVDLARDAKATIDGTKRLSIMSPSGRTTGKLNATVNARASFSKTGSGVLNQGSAVSFPYSYRVNVNPVLQNLFVSLTGVRWITIEPGVSSKLTGSWNQFGLGWHLAGASISAAGDLDAQIDWPWPFGESRFDFLSASVSTPNLPLLVDFHRYQNFQRRWQGFEWGIFGCGVSGGIDLKPNPIGPQRNGISLNDPTDDGGAYYVTPNPYGIVPDWLVDVITFAVRPERGVGVSFAFTC